MVIRHLILSATHAEAGHFTSRTHAPSHSRAPMLELTDWPGERSERLSPPPTFTLSPALLLSPAAVTIETPPLLHRYKKILFYLFFYYAQSFLWRRPGAR